MNAITIQKRHFGQYVITGPHVPPMHNGVPRDIAGRVEALLSNLTPEGDPDTEFVTIPKRLEDYHEFWTEASRLLGGSFSQPGLLAEIENLKRGREESDRQAVERAETIQAVAIKLGCASLHHTILEHIDGLNQEKEMHRKDVLRLEIVADQIRLERDGLNKMFDGVRIERGENRAITGIHLWSASSSLQIDYEAGHDSKTPALSGYEELKLKVEAAWKHAMEHREEIMKAFAAKYGGQPDDFEQVEEPAWPGSYLRKWSVRRKVFYEHGKPVMEDLPPNETAFPWDCRVCNQRNSKYSTECGRCNTPRPMTSTQEPRRATFSIREAAKRILKTAQECPVTSLIPEEANSQVEEAIARIIEEFTGHKEQLIQELRRLWGKGWDDPDYHLFYKQDAEQISNLLSSPPVFHEPGEMIFTAKQMEAVRSSLRVGADWWIVRDVLAGKMLATRVKPESDPTAIHVREVRGSTEVTITREDLLSDEVRALHSALATAQSDLKLACQQRAEAMLAIEKLRGALETIEAWREFPPTGDDHSFAWHWGSNGERDHMRALARKAVEDWA